MVRNEQEVHVLMATLPMPGHMNPMLRLAKRLTSKGIHVTLATTTVALPSIENTIAKKPSLLQLEFFSDGLSHDFDREKQVDYFLESLQSIGSKNLSDLITNLTTKERKFSCIITNPFMPWVLDIAGEHDIRCAVHWIQACAVYSIYYHFFNKTSLFPSLEDQNESVELPGLPMLLVNELPSFILPYAPFHFKKLVEDLMKKLDTVKWVLGNSFTELEENVVVSMVLLKPIIAIGPLVSPFMFGKEEIVGAKNSYIEWLDNQPPSSVIYISFGSILVPSKNQIESIAAALKNIKKPFLWVIKSAEISLEFLEETKERGLVLKWCDQEKVLMHTSVACFMTHCGWNSTLESVVAGVPVIAYPEWTDQPTDAKLLVDVLKIGVRMRNGKDGVLSSEEVERCILEVTDGVRATKMKNKAMALKEAAHHAVEDGGSSAQNLDNFINEISGKSF